MELGNFSNNGEAVAYKMLGVMRLIELNTQLMETGQVKDTAS